MHKTPEFMSDLQYLSCYDYERAVYDRMIKDYRDYLCDMDAAEDRGIEKGIVKGIEMGKAGVAKNMLSTGLSIETISSATGLSQEAIAGLRTCLTQLLFSEGFLRKTTTSS